MKKELIKLADFFDNKGMQREANIIDSFIVKAQSADTTWMEEDTRNGDFNNQTPPSQGYRISAKIQLADGIFLDLNTHPLGQKILNFVKNIFLLADSSTDEGLLSVKDLEEITKLCFKYDDELNIYKSLNDNENPISPTQLQKIINDAIVYYSRGYQTSGIIDPEVIRDLTFNLIQYYNDVYMEEFLKFAPQKYPVSGGIPGIEQQELSELEKEKLWEKEDSRLMGDAEQPFVENIDPKTNEKRDKLREQMKKETPKEWHSILFDK